MDGPDDRRLYLVASLPAGVNRFISLSEDLAPAWATRRPVAAGRRHVTLMNLSVAELSLHLLIRLARRFVADALPQAFHVNVDELVVTRERALLRPSEPVRGAIRAQAELRAAAARGGLALPPAAAPVPHVTLGYDYPHALPARRIDGIGWRIEELRLVLSHHGRTLHETVDRWDLASARALAA